MIVLRSDCLPVCFAVDGDGKLDYMVTTQTGTAVTTSLYRNTGTPTLPQFGAAVAGPSFTAPGPHLPALWSFYDANGDGKVRVRIRVRVWVWVWLRVRIRVRVRVTVWSFAANGDSKVPHT